MGTASLPLINRPASPRLHAVLRVLFSFPSMLVSGLVFLTFWGAAGRFDDPDLWWHLRLGQTIWDTGSIPASDQFSFTATGHEWVAHEWLPRSFYFFPIGLADIRRSSYGCASSPPLLSDLLSVRWSGDWKVSVLGGMLALFMLTVSLAIRPLLLGHLFLLLELQVLQAGIIRQSKWIWLLPPLFVIWTNCHGYLLWARPSQPVFIDGRADIYAWTGVLREYGRWATLKDDPRMLLDRYGIQACLLPATAPMSRVLPLMPHWKLAYSDNLAVVYVREDAEGSRRPSNGEF